jgi:hypothetical protein
MRNRGAGREVGIDLLLAGSDAFKHLAEELAAAHDRWQALGAEPATLDWARRLAEHAGWWCGRLEGEADALFAGADGVSRDGAEGCRRRRRRRCC